ncbi:hypothetical protein [Chryseobacterium terrae]|uniref:DUF4476 domain-containing protein n=1 Tax=Chryseobacterium terrae TaxID=3163299 RepID=A0ABW8Y5K1_9FLAO
MKKNLLFVLLIFFINISSQVKALTEDGKEVVLFDNKTWKFINESDEKTLEEIKDNTQSFSKSKDATFLMKSKKTDAGVYFNPKKWKIVSSDLPSPYMDYLFANSSNANLFVIFGSENAPVQTLKNLKDLVIAGVQRNTDYFKLKESEYRTVNNIKVLYLNYVANIKGIDFEYLANYYLTSEGYTSLMAYTFANKFEENKAELETFINGITKAEKSTKSDIVEVIKTNPPPPMKTNK